MAPGSLVHSTKSTVVSQQANSLTAKQNTKTGRSPSPHRQHQRIADIASTTESPAVHTYDGASPMLASAKPGSFTRAKRDTSLAPGFTTPGIGQYNTEDALDRVKPSALTNTGSFARTKRQIRLQDTEETPGVTDYHPNHNIKAKRMPAFKFTTAERQGLVPQNQMTRIGPGHYDTDTSAASRLLSATNGNTNAQRPKSLTLSSSEAVNTLKRLSASQSRRNGTGASVASSVYTANSTTSNTAKSLIHNNTPTTLVPSYSHDVNARFKANPAFSFGRTKRESSIDAGASQNAPSVHDYYTEIAFNASSRSKSTAGAASFFRSKRKTFEIAEGTPGVAQYQVEAAIDKVKPSLPRVAQQTSKRVIKLQDSEETPGVTDYYPNHNVRMHSLGSVATVKAPRFQEAHVQNSPPVHTYASDPLKLKHKAPQPVMHLYGK